MQGLWGQEPRRKARRKMTGLHSCILLFNGVIPLLQNGPIFILESGQNSKSCVCWGKQKKFEKSKEEFSRGEKLPKIQILLSSMFQKIFLRKISITICFNKNNLHYDKVLLQDEAKERLACVEHNENSNSPLER